jgi:hypothetical protein
MRVLAVDGDMKRNARYSTEKDRDEMEHDAGRLLIHRTLLMKRSP